MSAEPTLRRIRSFVLRQGRMTHGRGEPFLNARCAASRIGERPAMDGRAGHSTMDGTVDASYDH